VNQNSAGPLSGVVVLDLTQHLAGPFATQILGDLGARVIKVEPIAGDTTRLIAPYFVAGESDYYISANRNKECVAINLKAPEGRQLLLDLADQADVLVDNFKPGTMARLGLGYDTFQAVNPRLVVCSISGFGQTGGHRDAPAFDMVIQAMSGVMSITGEPGGKTVRTGTPVGDLTAGLYGAIGILAALARRDRSGEGSFVDISMYDGQLSMLSYLAAYYLLAGEVPGPQGRAHRSTVTYRAYTCADGLDIVVTATTESQWRSLCRALDITDWGSGFVGNVARLEHRAEVDAVVEAAFLRLDVAEASARLHANGVPCGTIRGVDEALDDPVTAARDMVIDLTGPDGQHARVVGNPVKISGYTERRTFPSRIGEHTTHVLAEFLDLDVDQVGRLAESGVVGLDAGPRPGDDAVRPAASPVPSPAAAP
jgi:crotonobetainyl-CoA:carnitine CoA-transferase CaiB-like acyl-CoA transferase